MTPVGYGGAVASRVAGSQNSLIAAPELPGWMDGVGPFQDGQDLAESFQTGDWVEGVLAGGSIGLSVADAVINPIATLVSMGVGWMLEHLYPLADWLDALTGDHRMVMSYSATWANVSQSVSGTSDTLYASLAQLQSMEGATVEAYEALVRTMAGTLAGAAQLASGVSTAVALLSSIVKAVHDLVRNVLSDLVGFIVQELVEIAATLGAATPVVAAQVAMKTANWAKILLKFVKSLVTSAGTYVGLASTLKGLYDDAVDTLNGHMAGAH